MTISFWRLGWRTLWRDLRSGELRLLIVAVTLAVAALTAVGFFADRLKGGPPIRGAWPREDRALTRDERVELQRLLTAAGFDAGGVDGLMGPKTIAAVKAWQLAQGLVPDGYANPALLERLR